MTKAQKEVEREKKESYLFRREKLTYEQTLNAILGQTYLDAFAMIPVHHDHRKI